MSQTAARKYGPNATDRPAETVVLILGNLQSGKTSLFRRLSGAQSYQVGIPESSRVLSIAPLGPGRGLARWVDALRRRMRRPENGAGESRNAVLLDTPGIASLFPQGEEDLVVQDALVRLSPSVLLIVVDAKNLKRGLALVAHAAELELPCVLALNMVDEAERRGIAVDDGLLSVRLGIDVVPTVGSENVGVERLRAAILEARVPRRFAAIPRNLEKARQAIRSRLAPLGPPSAGLDLRLFGTDPEAEKEIARRFGETVLTEVRDIVARAAAEVGLPLEVIIQDAFHRAADRLASEAITRTDAPAPGLAIVGRLAHHPLWGTIIAIAVIWAMYLWVGELGATRVVDALRLHLFDEWLLPWSDRLVSHLPWPLVREAIMDRNFGLVPTGLFLAFGLVMPVLVFFYFAFNLLLESGYLPRLSILLDRVFRAIGLNGKGILPLAMGFSCVTMALITTRMLESKKERIIASLLLLLGVPCAPLLAVMLVILADLPVTASIALFGVITAQILAAGFAANRILPGLAPDFILEIPPMRLPKWRTVMVQTVRQTYGFMQEAVPLFLLGSFILFVFDRIGGLALLEQLSRPVVHGLLGLPAETVQVFIKTLIRREAGAAELATLRSGFDSVQLLVTLLVMTTLTPCVNALLVLIKERGPGIALAVVGLVSVWAVLIGTLFNLVCRGLGLTFS